MSQAWEQMVQNSADIQKELKAAEAKYVSCGGSIKTVEIREEGSIYTDDQKSGGKTRTGSYLAPIYGQCAGKFEKSEIALLPVLKSDGLVNSKI